MEHPDHQAESAVLAYWNALGRPSLAQAALAVGTLAQPLDESAAERTRREGARQLLGVTSSEDQLVAALKARELLQRLAQDNE